MRKSITWITPDYFVDCDNNPGLWKDLLRSYHIRWIVILPVKEARFKEADFTELRSLPGLTIEFLYCKYRQRDPRRLFFYKELYSLISKVPHDLLYFNYVLSDPYGIPFFWLLNKRRTIFSAHDGMANASFKAPLISRLIFHLTFPLVQHANLFSLTQAKLFLDHFPNARVHINPLALKSFGPGVGILPETKIQFLCFGVINYPKHIDLMIQAACNIYEKGYQNFSVSICGTCVDWSFYQRQIRYPELFNCQIRLIDNSEIPDLFTSHHYLVQPYRMLSQSGPLKIAFNYNLPVIASDLDGFKNEISENISGYFFREGDLEDLERVLIRVLQFSTADYTALKNRMKAHIARQYSLEAVSGSYNTMFQEVLDLQS